MLVCEAITDVDVTAAGMLEQLDQELNADGVRTWRSSRCAPGSRISSSGTDCSQTLDRDHFYPSVEAALAAIEEEEQ